MTNNDRNRLRKLQDKLLKTHAVQYFVDTHGDHFPLWQGGPNASQLRSCVCPEWERDMRAHLAAFTAKPAVK